MAILPSKSQKLRFKHIVQVIVFTNSNQKLFGCLLNHIFVVQNEKKTSYFFGQMFKVPAIVIWKSPAKAKIRKNGLGKTHCLQPFHMKKHTCPQKSFLALCSNSLTFLCAIITLSLLLKFEKEKPDVLQGQPWQTGFF